jgi:ribonuclease P protein component
MISHEKNLSTQQPAPEAHPWFSCTHGNQTRPPGVERASRQRPGKPLPLSSSRRRFPPEVRLRTAADFNRVFMNGVRFADDCFRVHACPNQRVAARLGITVARTVASSAVVRNRIKRQIRESFRHNYSLLPAMDIVMRAKPAAAIASNQVIRSSLEQHWQELIKRCATS